MSQKVYIVTKVDNIKLSAEEIRREERARKGKAFGIASFVLSLIALVLETLGFFALWVPFLDYLFIILAALLWWCWMPILFTLHLLSFIFGLSGIIRCFKEQGNPDADKGRGFSIAGLVMFSISMAPIVMAVLLYFFALILAIIFIIIVVIIGILGGFSNSISNIVLGLSLLL